MFQVEKEFEYENYKCVVIFDELGYYEGYAEVPESHPFYDRALNRLNDEYGLNLSYAGKLLPFNDDTFRVGFTCDQQGIKPDTDRVKQLWGEKAMVLNYLNMQKISLIPKNGKILTAEHAEKKLKTLVDIIKSYGE